MKRTVAVAAAVLSCVVAGALVCQEWQTVKSDHFIVHYTGDGKFAKEILEKAEKYYVWIASSLGYPRYSEFWTWDNRVRIYLYPDKASFQKASRQPDWSHGMADYTNKRIMSYVSSAEFADSMLPHEMAHLIFRDFIGFKGEVPVWIDEGVAQWAESMKRERVNEVSKYLLEKDAFYAVEDMVRLDIRDVTGRDDVTIRSLAGADGRRRTLSVPGKTLVDIYYIEAVSLIGFLIQRYGATSFTSFCRELRDGKPLDDALRSAYAGRLGGTEELEREWVKYIASDRGR